MANPNPNLNNLKPFKPGQSGNPEGTKPGKKNRATIAKKWLDLEIKAKNPITNIEELLSLEDLITLNQIKAANDAESSAYKVLMDSRYGAPKQEIEGMLNGNILLTFDKQDELIGNEPT